MATGSFEGVVREFTGAGYVERRWLLDEITDTLADKSQRFVLVTGVPGTGKTSLASKLIDENDNWLRYFVGRDDGGVHAHPNVTEFLKSIGHQFARRYPQAFNVQRLDVVVRQWFGTVETDATVIAAKIGKLVVSPFVSTAAKVSEQLAQRVARTVTVEQHAEHMAGTVTGVEIGSMELDPDLMDSETLAQVALIAPAQVLLESDPSARIVIVLDGLDIAARERLRGRDDDAAGRLHSWLGSVSLPPNVQVVLTSRPDSALGMIRTLQRERLTEITLDTEDARTAGDLASYAASEIPADCVAESGMLPDDFYRRLARHAHGNFQYLATYARALDDAAKTASEAGKELTARLLRLDSFPSDLRGIYAELAVWAQAEIERLGDQKVHGPRGARRFVPAWERVGRPILGILTVAREPLTIEQLMAFAELQVYEEAVRDVLSRLQFLLEPDRIAFFHESVGEFFAAERLSEVQWHDQIADYYYGQAASWTEVDWSQVDRYALEHLPYHVERSGDASELVSLVCPGLRRAIRAMFGTDRRFLEVADRAAEQVARDGDVTADLAQIVYLGVVRNLGSRASIALPPRALGLLARRGRLREALDRVTAMPPSVQQFVGVREICACSPPGEDLLDLLAETAVAAVSGAAVKIAAREIAPFDLERALRLWRHATSLDGGEREPPDPLYSAAARAEATIDTARALLDKVQGDKINDYVELAARATPEQAGSILEPAQADLSGQPPHQRLVSLARLAAAWHPHSPERASALLADLRATAFEAVGHNEFEGNAAEAAALIADTDRETARLLLAPLDLTMINGYTERGLLRAFELWTRWGEPDRAQPLADLLAWWGNRGTGSTRVLRAMNAYTIDVVEEKYAQIPRADEIHGFMETSDRDRSLASVAKEFTEFDADRAADVAREISSLRWTSTSMEHPSINPDRYTSLAQIAHHCLDGGDIATADRLLEEILRETEADQSLAAQESWSCYAPESFADTGSPRITRMTPVDPIGEPRSIRHSEMEGIMLVFNLSNDWAGRARRQFFRDPADLVRNVSSGPYRLARVVRLLAEADASRDLRRAAELAESITDPGERAIGFAALNRAAHDNGYCPPDDTFSEEIDGALADMEAYRWSFDGMDADKKAWAYVRPDYRVRFEVGIRALGCRLGDYRALDGMDFLVSALQMSVLLWASGQCVQALRKGDQPNDSFIEMHRMLLCAADRNPVADITRAQAAYHDYLIQSAVPGYRSKAGGVQISDLRYAAVVDLCSPAPGMPLNPAFPTRIDGLLTEGKIEAAAALVAFAAQARPEYEAELRRLAARVRAVAEADDASPQDRIDALSHLADLDEEVDPVQLLRDARACKPQPYHLTWAIGEVQGRLFPVLARTRPGAALRQLYQAVSDDWEMAMRLLEHIITAGTPDFAPADIGDAIQRGIACVARDGTVPEIVDGVDLELLAGLS